MSHQLGEGKTVLVTSLGSTAGDIVVKTLKRLGYRVVASDIYAKELVVDAWNVDQFYQVPLISDEAAFVPVLHDICEREGVNLIVPLTDLDVDYLNANRGWFEERGITLCISPKHSLDIIRDKKKLQDFIAQNCPLTKSVPTVYMKDVETAPWAYPVVCKPCNGRSSQGLRYVHNDVEWNALKHEVAGTPAEQLYIVEPFVEGPIVMCEVVRQPQTGDVVAVTREEKLDTPTCLAISVYVYQDEQLEHACRVLADKLDIWGSVNFEFLRSPDGVYHFIECNPRFSAGTEFTHLGGYDCVGNHMRAFEGKAIDRFTFTNPRYIARKYEEYVTKIEEA